jgi:hypothetical protein
MKLLIHAVDDRRVMLLRDDGHVRPGRYAGRDAAGVALPEGETVPDLDHYRRAARRGDLRIEEVGS